MNRSPLSRLAVTFKLIYASFGQRIVDAARGHCFAEFGNVVLHYYIEAPSKAYSRGWFAVRAEARITTIHG